EAVCETRPRVVELVEPDVRYEASYRAAMRGTPRRDAATRARRSTPTRRSAPRRGAARPRAGARAPAGWVGGAGHWVRGPGTSPRRVQVRRELTEALRRYGGHVGYSIRPSARGQGHRHDGAAPRAGAVPRGRPRPGPRDL